MQTKNAAHVGHLHGYHRDTKSRRQHREAATLGDMLRWVLRCLALGLLFWARPAAALIEPFTPGYIISDEEFVASNAMSCGEIQGFLEGRTGSLKSYVDNGRYASQIFCDAAATHQINPRILLVMAQKEMALLGDPAPDDKQLAWALGCGPGWESTRGFAVNVDCGAKTLRKRFDQTQTQLGASIDGVAPLNRGTLALYRYTTHVKGNEDFWKIWTRYWPASSAASGAVTSGSPPAVTIDQRTIIVPLSAIELTPPLRPNSTCRSGWARGQNYLVTPNAATPSESTNIALWRPTLPRAGQYRVSAYVPRRGAVPWACGKIATNNDTANARYEFTYAGGARFDILLNQSPLNDQWAELGTFRFDAGTAGFVRLSDTTGEASNSTWVSVDALKFEWLGE